MHNRMITSFFVRYDTIHLNSDSSDEGWGETMISTTQHSTALCHQSRMLQKKRKLGMQWHKTGLEEVNIF